MKIFSHATQKTTFLLLTLLSGIGCGGGGGGGSEFAGVWNGYATLVDDTCGIISNDLTYISFSHLVNQSEDKIVLDNGLLTFSGHVNDDSSFTADTIRAHSDIGDQSGCKETITWRYEQIHKDTAQFVVRNSKITCENDFSCEFAYSGSASLAGSVGFPIPIDIGIGGATSATDATAATTLETDL